MNQQREAYQALSISAAQAAERAPSKKLNVRGLLQTLQAEINEGHGSLTTLEEVCECIASPKDTRIQNCTADKADEHKCSTIVQTLLEAISEQKRLSRRIHQLIDDLEI